jgi:hypothetical protein
MYEKINWVYTPTHVDVTLTFTVNQQNEYIHSPGYSHLLWYVLVKTWFNTPTHDGRYLQPSCI